ncbi:Coiled-coil domain-containing protein 24 [Channa argus]|uniref:Coiled-coil domain-containing protein 24 n=1 Tax=Channa argus TaxID=215402 RepID=A0A6G1QAP9_CHAAH|nr:Coiled-coil domain-containing protein 24 [Channa argus]
MWYMMWQESQQGQQQGFLLSDPPAVKELVRAEVKMLLQTLRERASEEGRDCKELLLRYNPDTVNYALSHNESCYDNCTNPGDIDSGSRPSTHCSIRSNAADEIEAVRDKLNVTDFDQVVNCLRSLLMEECEVLKKLVQHLRKIIKQNYGCKSLVKKSEPSLAELRELRGAVQMDLKLYPTSFVAFPTASSPFTVKKLRNRFRCNYSKCIISLHWKCGPKYCKRAFSADLSECSCMFELSRPSVGLRAADETLQALTASSAARPHPPPSPCHTNPRPPHGRPHTKTSTSAKPIHTASPSMAHGTTSAITNSSNKITTSEHMNSHFISDQIIVKKLNNCSLSSDPGSCCSHSSDHSLSTIEKSKIQKGQQKGAFKVSSILVETDNDRKKNTSESFYRLALSETGSTASQSSSRKSSSGIDGNKNGHLRKDVHQQLRLHSQCFTHHSLNQSDSSGELTDPTNLFI